MKIMLNGIEEKVLGLRSLAELIAAKKLRPERIVVECNSRIVPREEWETQAIGENDSIEIVSFVGGG